MDARRRVVLDGSFIASATSCCDTECPDGGPGGRRVGGSARHPLPPGGPGAGRWSRRMPTRGRPSSRAAPLARAALLRPGHSIPARVPRAEEKRACAIRDRRPQPVQRLGTRRQRPRRGTQVTGTSPSWKDSSRCGARGSTLSRRGRGRRAPRTGLHVRGAPKPPAPCERTSRAGSRSCAGRAWSASARSGRASRSPGAGSPPRWGVHPRRPPVLDRDSIPGTRPRTPRGASRLRPPFARPSRSRS
jgi:hypothetical protein